MAITREQYAQADAVLEKMWTRLIKLAVEIDKAEPVTDKKGFTYQAACRAGDVVAHLRHMLATSRNIRAWVRRLGVGCRGKTISG